MNKEQQIIVTVGQIVTVLWSNGHGYSVYRIVETVDGPHALQVVEEKEYQSNG